MSEPSEATGYLRVRSRNQKVGTGDTLMTVTKASDEDVTIKIVMREDPLSPGDEVEVTVVDGPKNGGEIRVQPEYEDIEVPGYWTRLGSRVAVSGPGKLPGAVAAGSRIKLRLL